MKHFSVLCLSVVLLSAASGALTTTANAQNYRPKYLREGNKDFLQLTTYTAENGWIEFRRDTKRIESASFFTDFGSTIGLSDGYSMRQIKDVTDAKRGTRHQRYQLLYKNIPVQGSEYTLHSRNGRLEVAQGRIVENLTVDVSKPILERVALEIALLDQKLSLTDLLGKAELPKGTLVLTSVDGDFVKESYRFAYYFDLYSKDAADNLRLYIDALSGEVLQRVPLAVSCFSPESSHIHDKQATSSIYPFTNKGTKRNAPTIAGSFQPNNARYLNGQSLRSFEVERTTTDPNNPESRLTMSTATVPQALQTRRDLNGNGGPPFPLYDDPDLTNPTTAWGSRENNATTAHWVTWLTYQHFLNRYGLNGSDGQGTVARVLVGVNDPNARWYRQGQNLMTIGYSLTTNRSLSTVDIVAHEYGHGITERLLFNPVTNSGWEVTQAARIGEPGSLDEGFSDIIGTCMERELLPNTWDWTLGEDSWLLRNMANPPASPANGTGSQPEIYLGPNWDFSGNNTARHRNNGVLNKWFYTMITGSGPNNTVLPSRISFDEAMDIVYRGLDLYMNGASNYADARDAMRAAAGDLFGGCSFQQRTVVAAWAAVGRPSTTRCDPQCDFTFGSGTSVPTNANCNQSMTFSIDCSGGQPFSCNDVAYAYTGPGLSINSGGPSINVTTPASNGVYKYTVTMQKTGCANVPRDVFVTVNGNCGGNTGGCTQQAISVVAPTPNQTLTAGSFPFYFDIRTQVCDPQGISQVQYNINGNWSGHVDVPDNNSSQPYTLTAARWAALAGSNGAFTINQPGTYTIRPRLFSNAGGFLDASPVQINVVQGGGINPNPGSGLAFVNPPSLNCNSGQLIVSTTGGNGQPVEFRAPGLQDWNTNNVFNVPTWQRNGTTFTIQARQSGNEITPLTYTTSCAGYRFAAVDAEETQSGLLLAPNPTQGPFTVRFLLPAKQIATLSVVNVMGQLVWQRDVIGNGQTQTETVDIHRETTGQYVVRLKAANGERTGKVLLVR